MRLCAKDFLHCPIVFTLISVRVNAPRTMPTSQGQTQPPPRLTEADLISKMEQYGIGTDATVADHIQKQVRRCAGRDCFGRAACPAQLDMNRCMRGAVSIA